MEKHSAKSAEDDRTKSFWYNNSQEVLIIKNEGVVR